jgi:hypothetical protein
VDEHLAVCVACREAFDDVAVATRALSSWIPVASLDPGLEEKLVRLRPRTARRWVPIAMAAALAGVIAAAGGFATGRRIGESRVAQDSLAGDSTLRSFILLHEEPTWPPAASLSVARSGYGDWAADLSALGRHVSAEKLTEEPGVRIAMNGTVSPALDMSAARNLSGWYLLRARDYDEAVALARRGPHLRYGTILVRQIE